jgi:hypothetical protein
MLSENLKNQVELALNMILPISLCAVKLPTFVPLLHITFKGLFYLIR